MAELAPGPPAVLAAGIVFPILCTVTVGLRLYGCKAQGRRFSIDDWLLLPALALLWAISILVLRGVALKALAYRRPPPGPGETEASEYNFIILTARQTWWLFIMLQIPMLTFVKLSFVFFYRRLFSSGQGKKPFHIASIVTIALLILWAICFEFTQLFTCGAEVSAYWQSQGYAHQHCPHILEWNNAFAVSDAILDWVVYLLPVRQIFMLQLSLSRKLALVGMFSLGALTLAASMTRMVVQIRVSFVDFREGQDNDLIITSSAYWSLVESGLALLAACLPPIHAMMRQQLRRRASTSAIATGSRSGTHKYGFGGISSYNDNRKSRGTITKTTVIRQERRSASTSELRLAAQEAIYTDIQTIELTARPKEEQPAWRNVKSEDV